MILRSGLVVSYSRSTQGIDFRALSSAINTGKLQSFSQISSFDTRASFRGRVGSRITFQICDVANPGAILGGAVGVSLGSLSRRRAISASGAATTRLGNEFPEFKPRIDYMSGGLFGSQEVRSFGNPRLINSIKNYSRIIIEQYYELYLAAAILAGTISED